MKDRIENLRDALLLMAEAIDDLLAEDQLTSPELATKPALKQPAPKDSSERFGVAKMGRRRWEPYEDQYLKQNHGRRSAAAIAEALSRTVSSINNRALVLGITNAN